MHDEPCVERTQFEFRAERLGSALRRLAREVIDERRKVSELRREIAELRSRAASTPGAIDPRGSASNQNGRAGPSTRRAPGIGVQQRLTELRTQISMAEERFRARGEREAATTLADFGSQVHEAIEEVDEERRRIERDLHDGVQQRLVVLGIRLALAREQLAVNHEAGSAMLQPLGAEVDEILDEIRSLGQGVYPSLLVDRGLPDALCAVAARAPVPTEVDAPDLSRYPPEIEGAVYFVCLEALQNAVKHSRATHVSITLRGNGGDVRFAVSDDGAGFSEPSIDPGSGLRNMRARLARVGGELTVRSAPGRGTRVSGTVPAG
jgi:signal transduction histidine kinase